MTLDFEFDLMFVFQDLYQNLTGRVW